jgi:hypothetical protein
MCVILLTCLRWASIIGFWLLAALLVLKILWNLLVPYVLARQMWKSPTGRSQSVSMFTGVEVIIVLLAGLASWISSLQGYLAPRYVVTVGILATVVSYVHFFCVAIVAGLLRSLTLRIRNRNNPDL